MGLLDRKNPKILPHHIFFFTFKVVFIFKNVKMYACPASHLKVHASIEKGLAGEQSAILALCGVYFSPVARAFR
jgi:hypothetical protein